MSWLIIGLIVLVFLYVAFMVFFRLYWSERWSMVDKKFFELNWKKIIAEKDQQKKIMELDKLLDLMLKKRGLIGSLGEKLKKNPHLFSDLDGLWEAHKTRNKLAHELDYKLSKNVYNQSVESFKKAFNDLGLNAK